MSTATPLTDAINALTTYANETTGQSDTDLSSAVASLVAGYGGGGSHNLPSGYTEYEYIEGTGTQYIDTGYVPTADFEIVYIFERTASQSFGSSDWGVNANPRIQTSGNYWACGNKGDIIGDFNPDYYLFGTQKVRVNITGVYGGAFNEKSVDFGTLTWTTGNNTIYLMARNENGNAERKCKIRFYYWVAYENDVKQVEFIPAMRNSDSELGFYETVSGTFFTNAGTGTFVGGAF